MATKVSACGFLVLAFAKAESLKPRSQGLSAYFRRQTSGYKREFDPGSESTLAACLTHASRTGKQGQLCEYSGVRVSNT
jgi:hypothetical protein